MYEDNPFRRDECFFLAAENLTLQKRKIFSRKKGRKPVFRELSADKGEAFFIQRRERGSDRTFRQVPEACRPCSTHR